MNDIYTEKMSVEQVALAEEAGALAKRSLDGGSLDDAMKIGRSLLEGRRVAMDLNHTTRPRGRPYVESFSAWKERFGFPTDDASRSFFDACIYIAEHEEIAREIIREMPSGRRANLGAHGLAVRVRARLREQQTGGVNSVPPLRISPLAAVKQKLKESERQLADAEERIAATDDADGFNPLRLKPEVLARQIIENGSRHGGAAVAYGYAERLIVELQRCLEAARDAARERSNAGLEKGRKTRRKGNGNGAANPAAESG
jgi:hypothetical protein